MTETTYMTADAWAEMTPYVIKGPRNMNKNVKANSRQFVLEIFNGFGDHLELLPAMAQRTKNKTLSLKEEGKSSHLNQSYKKIVAKSDKVSKDESLAMLHSTASISQGVVDLWGLIQCGLYAIRCTKRYTWTIQFDACNMYPRTQVSFQYLKNKTEFFLQAGQLFKSESVDTYLLLPTFWNGMKPKGRKAAVTKFHKHQGYNTECCK